HLDLTVRPHCFPRLIRPIGIGGRGGITGRRGPRTATRGQEQTQTIKSDRRQPFHYYSPFSVPAGAGPFPIVIPTEAKTLLAGGYRSVNQTVIFFTTCTKVPLSLALSNGAVRL